MIEEPRTRPVTVETADGWSLDVLHIPGTAPVRGVAVLGHAMMVDRRSMDRPRGAGFASRLAESGWEVWLADLRGRGKSRPKEGEGRAWGYDDLVRFDLPALVAAARERFPGLPVWVVGQSLTGHVSIAAAGTGAYAEPPDGHLLLSVNTWQPSLEPSWLMRMKKGASFRLFAELGGRLGSFPARRLGVGPVDEAGPYCRDLYAFWARDRWGSRDGEHDYLASMPRVRGPVRSVVGRGDRLLAHPVGARNWFAHLGRGDADFEVVGRGDYGLPFDPDHMTLVTDDRAAPLWSRLFEWMADQTDALDAAG